MGQRRGLAGPPPRPEGGQALLQVQVTPGARRDQVVGLANGVLRVQVAAPPREGRANEALVRLLSEALGLAQEDLLLLQGHTSRRKRVRVAGLTPSELERRLRERHSS